MRIIAPAAEEQENGPPVDGAKLGQAPLDSAELLDPPASSTIVQLVEVKRLARASTSMRCGCLKFARKKQAVVRHRDKVCADRQKRLLNHANPPPRLNVAADLGGMVAKG
jgi:hypothetical protein